MGGSREETVNDFLRNLPSLNRANFSRFKAGLATAPPKKYVSAGSGDSATQSHSTPIVNAPARVLRSLSRRAYGGAYTRHLSQEPRPFPCVATAEIRVEAEPRHGQVELAGDERRRARPYKRPRSPSEERYHPSAGHLSAAIARQ